MSKIGKKIILIPDKVEINISENELKIKGIKGEITIPLFKGFKIELNNKELKVIPIEESKKTSAFWGTLSALISNAVKGVTEGFEKKLEIEGIGYRANVEGRVLVLNLGYSHPIRYDIPEGINITTEKNIITVSGINKQLVGQTAAKIRSFRKPEPYKGKGIHYVNEYIRRKAGKKATGAAAS